MRLRALPALALVAALVAGCNGDDPPPKLSKEDAAALADTRESLDDALDTTEALRTSNREARRLVRGLERRLQITETLRSKLVSPISPADDRAVQSWHDGLSDRRLAAASELVPSLVFTDPEGDRPLGLDTRALGEFLRDAEERPARALHRPAAADVRMITGLLKGMDAGTKIVTLDNVTAARFLEQTAGDLRPVWRDLAGELTRARGALG